MTRGGEPNLPASVLCCLYAAQRWSPLLNARPDRRSVARHRGPPALSGSHGLRQGGVPASSAAMILSVTS